MNPDKYVRQAIFNAINNMVVDTKTVPCFDVSATNYRGKQYVIMSTQNKSQEFSKCGDYWEYSILLDIVTRLKKNSGSRLLADNIEEEILNRLDTITFGGGFTKNRVNISSEPDLTNVGDNEIVHRKFLRYTFEIT